MDEHDELTELVRMFRQLRHEQIYRIVREILRGELTPPPWPADQGYRPPFDPFIHDGGTTIH
jgi:hypothetical protein